MDVRLHFADENQRIGLWRNIAMLDGVAVLDKAGMRSMGDAYKKLLRDYEHVASLCVMRPNCTASSEVSQEAARFSKELGPKLVHVAIVVEAQGVVAQIHRSAVRAFSVFSRHPPLSVDSTVPEAARVLARFVLGVAPGQRVAQELSAAFASLRAGLPLP